MQVSPVTLREPVHGDIALSREELAIIDTREFQRLRGIKQLGTANLVYPGANHSRFDHSIGTMHMTGRLLDAIDRHAARDTESCHRVQAEERRLLRIAALVHDITHIPFGHNIEDQTGLMERHDEPARFLALLTDSEVGAALDKIGLRDQVLAILADQGDPVPPFWKQVLSDTIDADLLDYLRRDAYFTGLELRYDQRVCEYFRIDRDSKRMFVDCEKQGMLREDIMSELLRVLEIRYHFSERVYYHHAKVAAGALLARMVELAMGAGALDARRLQESTDQSLLDFLATVELGDAASTERLRRYSRRFARRQLPKRVIVLPAYLNGDQQEGLIEEFFRPRQAGARTEWETRVEKEAAKSLGRELDIIMYCPARRMQLKEARTLVRLPGTGDRILELSSFADDIPRLQDLQERYPRLWKLYVFTSEEDADARRKIQEICMAALPAGCRNALKI